MRSRTYRKPVRSCVVAIFVWFSSTFGAAGQESERNPHWGSHGYVGGSCKAPRLELQPENVTGLQRLGQFFCNDLNRIYTSRELRVSSLSQKLWTMSPSNGQR